MANIPRTTLFEKRLRKKSQIVMKTVLRYIDTVIVPDPIVTQEIPIFRKKKKFHYDPLDYNRVNFPLITSAPFIQDEIIRLKKRVKVKKESNADEQFNRPQIIPAPVVGFSPTLSFVLNVTRTLTFTKEMIIEDV